MLLPLLLLQAASAETKPDIELNIHARARSVEIQQKGQARLRVTAEPDAGSRVESEVTPEAQGRTRLRNVEVDVRGEARIGGGASLGATAEADHGQAETSASETPQPD